MLSRVSGSVRRVLMTTDAVGGVRTYALDPSRALSLQGVAATIVSLGPLASTAERTKLKAFRNLR